MLYNIETKKVQDIMECGTCRYFDKHLKKCNGIGKACFEYDQKTMTLLDPITKMAFKPKEN